MKLINMMPSSVGIMSNSRRIMYAVIVPRPYAGGRCITRRKTKTATTSTPAAAAKVKAMPGVSPRPEAAVCGAVWRMLSNRAALSASNHQRSVEVPNFAVAAGRENLSQYKMRW